jgi:hypothetical protein
MDSRDIRTDWDAKKHESVAGSGGRGRTRTREAHEVGGALSKFIAGDGALSMFIARDDGFDENQCLCV